MTNNHEKRLPPIVLRAECGSVGAGDTAGRGKVSVDYWTTSKGDNKRPSRAEREEARLMKYECVYWAAVMAACWWLRDIKKYTTMADGFTCTSATPAIFRDYSNQHTTHRNHNHPQKWSSPRSFITIPILAIAIACSSILSLSPRGGIAPLEEIEVGPINKYNRKLN